VFSGAVNVSQTPLGAYLNHLFVIPGFRLYLVDASGRLIASSGSRPRAGATLEQVDGRLAQLMRADPSGSYASPRGSQVYVGAAVAGTPWRLVVDVPAAGLYASRRRDLMSTTNIVLTRNLTRDPELRSTPDGTAVCALRIASNARRKDATSGEWTDKPNYVDVTMFGVAGENADRYLTKGRGVAIDGRLDWHEWHSQDGSKRRAIQSSPTPSSSSAPYNPHPPTISVTPEHLAPRSAPTTTSRSDRTRRSARFSRQRSPQPSAFARHATAPG
jgi:single-stranded DNA-binding protein